MPDTHDPAQPVAHGDAEDICANTSTNPTLAEIVGERLDNPSRRGLLKGAAMTAALFFVGLGVAARTASASAAARPARLGFNAVAKSLADTVTVPEGYTAKVLLRLGDPIAANVPAYKNDGTDPAESFAMRAGDHHDGMHYFGLDANGRPAPSSSTRALLVQNHEAITPMYLHPKGATTAGSGAAQIRTAADEVLREFYVHGVSIVEIARDANGQWSYKQDSPFNRRIHTLTEMELSGPAAKTPYMVTKYSPTGAHTRGTLNNCANGYTPWGTYLTCEENWFGYFRRIAATDDPKRTPKEVASLKRNGIGGNGRELWATVTPDSPEGLYGRWNAEVIGAGPADDYRNAPNTYGWVVEIDPYAPTSVPKKRTALGRFAHEGAWPAAPKAGRPLVWYSGDDSRGEYIYKYVSTANWDPADATRGLAAGDKYLDNGKLYVAKFNADGTGQWLELRFGSERINASTPGYAFADQADVLINARIAADAVGATKMDRPEWGAVNPANGEVYFCLTNNNATNRKPGTTDAANPRAYADPDGVKSSGNPNGHIIRFRESGDLATATAFRWDIFLFGAEEDSDQANVNVSRLTAANALSSPDGLWFSQASGILWIQTDDGAFTDETNCMLLAAVPGEVGDGAKVTITNALSGSTATQETFVGGLLGEARLKRFLIGPKGSEVTGLAESPDGKVLLVNIQHPGEDTPALGTNPTFSFQSQWPGNGTTAAGNAYGPSGRPRSATIVITKNDGGVIGR